MRSDCPDAAIEAELKLRIDRIKNWRDIDPAKQRAIIEAVRARLQADWTATSGNPRWGNDIEPGMGYDTLEERAMDREPPE